MIPRLGDGNRMQNVLLVVLFRLEIDSPSRGRKLAEMKAMKEKELSLEIDSPSRGRKHQANVMYTLVT